MNLNFGNVKVRKTGRRLKDRSYREEDSLYRLIGFVLPMTVFILMFAFLILGIKKTFEQYGLWFLPILYMLEIVFIASFAYFLPRFLKPYLGAKKERKELTSNDSYEREIDIEVIDETNTIRNNIDVATYLGTFKLVDDKVFFVYKISNLELMGLGNIDKFRSYFENRLKDALTELSREIKTNKSKLQYQAFLENNNDDDSLLI